MKSVPSTDVFHAHNVSLYYAVIVLILYQQTSFEIAVNFPQNLLLLYQPFI